MLLLEGIVEGMSSVDEGDSLVEDSGTELEIDEDVVDFEVSEVVEDSAAEYDDCVSVEDAGIEL